MNYENKNFHKIEKFTNKRVRFRDLIVFMILSTIVFLITSLSVLLPELKNSNPDPVNIWLTIGFISGGIILFLFFYIIFTRTKNGIKHYEILYIKIKYLLLVKNHSIKYEDKTYFEQTKNIENIISENFNEIVNIQKIGEHYQTLYKLSDLETKSHDVNIQLQNLYDISEEIWKGSLDMVFLSVYEPVNWDKDVKLHNARWKKQDKPQIVNYLLGNTNHKFNSWRSDNQFLMLMNLKNLDTLDYRPISYYHLDTTVKNDNGVGNKKLYDLDTKLKKVLKSGDVNHKIQTKESILPKISKSNYDNLVEVERYILFKSKLKKVLIENVNFFVQKIQTRGIAGKWVNHKLIKPIIKKSVFFTENDRQIISLEEQKDLVIRKNSKNLDGAEIKQNIYTRILSLDIDPKSKSLPGRFWMRNYSSNFNVYQKRFIPNIKYLTPGASEDAFRFLFSGINTKLDTLERKYNSANNEQLIEELKEKLEIITEIQNKKENIAVFEGVFVISCTSDDLQYDLENQDKNIKKHLNEKQLASHYLNMLEEEINSVIKLDGFLLNKHSYQQLKFQNRLEKFEFSNLSGLYTESSHIIMSDPFLNSSEKHDIGGVTLGVDLRNNSPISINFEDYAKGENFISFDNTLLSQKILFGKYSSGNMLFSGPMGSGKSTASMKTILNLYNAGKKVFHIDPEDEKVNEINMSVKVPNSDYKMVSFDYTDVEKFQPISPIIPQRGIDQEEDYLTLLDEYEKSPSQKITARINETINNIRLIITEDVKSQIAQFFRILFKIQAEEIQQTDFIEMMSDLVDNYYTEERVQNIIETQKWPTMTDLLEIFKNNFYKEHFKESTKIQSQFTINQREEKIMKKIREVYGAEVRLMFKRFKLGGDLYRYFNTDSFIDFNKYNFVNFSIKKLESLRDPQLKTLIWMSFLNLIQSILSTFKYVEKGFVVFFDEFHKVLGSLNDGSEEMKKITGLFATYIQTQARQSRKFNVMNIFSSQNLTDFVGGNLGHVLKNSVTFGFSADPDQIQFDEFFADHKDETVVDENGNSIKANTDDYKELIQNLRILNSTKKPNSAERAKGTFLYWRTDSGRLYSKPLLMIYTQNDSIFTGVKDYELWENDEDAYKVNEGAIPLLLPFTREKESMQNLYILSKLKQLKEFYNRSPEDLGFYDYDDRVQALKHKYGKNYDPKLDV